MDTYTFYHGIESIVIDAKTEEDGRVKFQERYGYWPSLVIKLKKKLKKQ